MFASQACTEGERTVRAEAAVRTHDGRRLAVLMAVHFPPVDDLSRVIFTKAVSPLAT